MPLLYGENFGKVNVAPVFPGPTALTGQNIKVAGRSGDTAGLGGGKVARSVAWQGIQ